MNMNVARERVRVARALPELPKISQAFAEGRVSFSKVRAMTRGARANNEHAFLAVALNGTAHHVERYARAYRHCQRLEALQRDNEQHAKRSARLWQDEDDSWVLSARLTAEQGALLEKALDKAMDELFEEQRNVAEDVSAETPEPKGYVPDTFRRNRADGLSRVVEHYLNSNDATGSSGDRYLVNIHTEMETLQEDGDGCEADLEDRGHVAAETARRISCDASVVHWVDDADGHALDIGRKSRTIPPAIRRALQRRDKGCRFPGCTATRFVDAHHVHHWADGGETKMDNLVLLCRAHHRLVHEGGFGVEMTSKSEPEFTLPSGKVLPQAHPPRFSGNVVAIRELNRRNGHNIDARTSVPGWDGEDLDLEHAMFVLMQYE